MLCSTSTTVMPSRGQLADQRVDLARLGLVQAGGRLVEQQQLRLGGQRARDLQPLERAVGHRVGRRVDRSAPRPTRRISARARRRGTRARRARSAGRRSSAGSSAQRSRRWRPVITFSSALMLKNTCRFWNVRPMPAAAQRCGGWPVRSRPPSADAAGVGRVDAGHQVEQRRLAGAVGADDRMHRAAPAPRTTGRRWRARRRSALDRPLDDAAGSSPASARSQRAAASARCRAGRTPSSRSARRRRPSSRSP